MNLGLSRSFRLGVEEAESRRLLSGVGVHVADMLSTQQLASEILQDPNIRLATRHPSGQVDNATAAREVRDIANARPAHRSRYVAHGKQGPGGLVELNPFLLQAMLDLSRQFTFTVSEIAGGTPARNTPFYDGRAFAVTVINGEHVGPGNPWVQPFEQAAAHEAGFVQWIGPNFSAGAPNGVSNNPFTPSIGHQGYLQVTYF